MTANGKDRKKALRERYENRHPEMGIVCWKSADRMWLAMSRDIRATYNSTKFQLELGSWPNRELQAAYQENPGALEWMVIKQLDYEDNTADYSDELELLFMEALEEHPDAQRMSTRRFC